MTSPSSDRRSWLAILAVYLAAVALVVWLGAAQLQGTAPEFGYDCSGPYVLAEAVCDG